MSLEAALEANTAAVNKLIVVSENLLKLRTDAIETVRNAAAPAGKKAAKPSETETPAAETTPEPAAETPATETKTAPQTASPELDPVQKSVANYVGQEGISAEERAARSAKTKEILGKVGAATVAEVPAEKGPAVIKAMETLLSKGNLLADAPAEDDLLAA